MLRLHFKGTTTIPIEAEVLSPGKLAGKTLTDIAALPVQCGNAQAPLGDFFSVSGDSGDGDVVIEGDCSRVKYIGKGMSNGRITVHGDAGLHAGAEMTGGELQIHGNAADWLGAEMRGGRIHVRGSAGSRLGAAYHGSRAGMRGGTILVEGSAGSEAGAVMRRGLIAIGGDSGDFAAANMIAGSVFIFGRPGSRLGAGMKRGTVALFGAAPQLLPTFRFDCAYRPAFLPLYLRQLRAWGFPVPSECINGLFRRYSGDLVALGKGEVLAWQGG